MCVSRCNVSYGFRSFGQLNNSTYLVWSEGVSFALLNFAYSSEHLTCLLNSLQQHFSFLVVSSLNLLLMRPEVLFVRFLIVVVLVVPPHIPRIPRILGVTSLTEVQPIREEQTSIQKSCPRWRNLGER